MPRRQHQALEAVARQRQRRAYVGATNLHSGGHRAPHEVVVVCDGQERSTSDSLALPRVATGSKTLSCQLDQQRDDSDAQRVEARTLASFASVWGADAQSSMLTRVHLCALLQQVLAHQIERVQRHAKSFKDEPWYSSAVGIGSKARVVLSALAQRDVAGSGSLRCRDVVDALQAPNFGLTELQVRALLSRFNSMLHDDSVVHYATFARAIQFPQQADAGGSDPERSATDVLFRHQTYVARIREHANRLAQTLSHDSSAPPTDRGVLTGSNAAFSALPVIPAALLSLSPPDKQADVDRLSFEFDRQRRANRMAAKASTLLAHIHRVEAVARHEQMLQEHHDALRLAAKALHRHDHYTRLLETETHDVRVLEKQCKGLVRSELTRANRNVSKDSMSYVEPP